MSSRARASMVALAAAVTVAGGVTPASADPAPVKVPHPVPAGEGCPATDGLRTVDTPATFPRTVALTFDDGPNPTWTPQFLAILRRHGVHGTFFLVGKRAEANPSLMAEIVSDGNVVGNHTWDHPTSGPGITGLTADQLADQLDRTEQLLRTSTGQAVCFFRAPQGKDSSPDIREASELRGLTVANMHSAHDYLQPTEMDPDWVDLITDRLIDQGDHPILLLHDSGKFRGNSVAALDRIITWYADRGYVFTDPAGRPFPDDPAVTETTVGFAVEPTAQQQRDLVQRSAARAISEVSSMTNSEVPEPEESSTSSESQHGSPAPAEKLSAPTSSASAVIPRTVVPGRRPGLALSAPL